MSRRSFMKSAAGVAAAVVTAAVAGKAEAADLGPVLAIINHPVKDYAAWRAVYDSVEPLRQKAGVTGAEVFQDPNDKNLVIVLHRFPSVEASQAFLGDPALKEAMMKGGVAAPPTVTLAVAA